MASDPSAPAFSPQSCKYHVFLSFRGEDTRKNFVDHLYDALIKQGIHTYKDDVTLPRGESIRPTLLKAIEKSQIAVIVFSENYADSSWCLDELEWIMKCNEAGQTVFPIFYKVEPSDVRKQKRKYQEAFSKHESSNNNKCKSWSFGWLFGFPTHDLENNKVESWRKALEKASNLSGWEPKNIANGHESKAIEEIVDTISLRLRPRILSANDKWIGTEARMQELKSNLHIEGGGVLMIGIWGVGGGGKTTLASSIYDEIRWQFHGCCFVENIRQEAMKYGLKTLQENILSNVLKQKQRQIERLDEGICIIKDRLHSMKVLIVLDDVDTLDHLQALAGSRDWFGKGSRIIITTRNKQLLNVQRVDLIHEISLLNDDEAMELFCKYSPQNNRPVKDYELLSKKVVSYAGGLPLALKILGCFLCDTNVTQWRDALDKFEETPHAGILEVLKISYNGLEPFQKALFLDIACFFRRVGKDKATNMHVACGFNPAIEVKTLIQKALITISDGKFDMHNLVKDMAHHIVRGEHYNNPAKHSRVWKMEDVQKVCAMDATTELDKIEAIRFNCNRNDPLQHLPVIVANMKNVRWIDGEGGLASPLPSNFLPMKLCCLTLEGISQKQLWDGRKNLLNLKMMELNGSRNLIMTPDFEGLRNLERFKLSKCSRLLEEIDSSIKCLKSLAFLSIEFCFSLKKFPPITQLEKLESLTFSRCPKLFKQSEIQQNMNHIVLQFSHVGLRKLELSYCELGDEDMVSTVWDLPNLRKLDLTANKISQLSFSLLQLPRLKWLNISRCERLLDLSDVPSSVAVVLADKCRSLESFGDISNCKWLWKVSHRRGNKLSGDTLLPSMLKGNATEEYFISVVVDHHKPEGFVGKLFRGKTFTLHLLPDWYKNYCGFLICVVTNMKSPRINITIKRKVEEDQQESNYEAEDPEYEGTTTSVGYVSFNSLLRQTALSTSSCNIISLSVEDRFLGLNAAESYVGAKLIRREITNNEVRTTKDCSEFWDEEHEDRNTFKIEHDSNTSIKIEWIPY